jgi:hypothetical protein
MAQDPLPDKPGEEPMDTITSDPGGLGELPEPRTTYSTCMLLHNVLRILAADDCAIVTTTANVGPSVRAARDLLLALGIEPGMGEP